MTGPGITYMSVATCAVIANVVPIFLIGLIAERAASRRKPLATRLARFIVDLCFATLMLILEIGLLAGVENDGLHRTAPLAWVASVLLLIGILYRWALLSPAPNDALDKMGTVAANWLRRRLGRPPLRESPSRRDSTSRRSMRGDRAGARRQARIVRLSESRRGG